MTTFNITAVKAGETWRFDDARVGLFAEPFIDATNRVIDARLPKGASECTVEFSNENFPGAEHFRVLSSDADGSYYYDDDLGCEFFLCPALFRYFASAPWSLYAKITPLKR